MVSDGLVTRWFSEEEFAALDSTTGKPSVEHSRNSVAGEGVLVSGECAVLFFVGEEKNAPLFPCWFNGLGAN